MNRHYTNICPEINSADSCYTTPFDTKRPLNLHDTDLYPEMTRRPEESSGASEMISCSARYHIGEFVNKLASTDSDKGEAIRDLKTNLNSKFIAFCDRSIPVQLDFNSD